MCSFIVAVVNLLFLVYVSTCVWRVPINYLLTYLLTYKVSHKNVAVIIHGSHCFAYKKIQGFSRTFQEPQKRLYFIYTLWLYNLSRNIHHNLQRNCSVSTQQEHICRTYRMHTFAGGQPYFRRHHLILNKYGVQPVTLFASDKCAHTAFVKSLIHKRRQRTTDTLTRSSLSRRC